MFLPLGDEPNPRGIAVVNYCLIAVNLVFFVFICWPLSYQAISWDTPYLEEYLRGLSQRTQYPMIRDLSMLQGHSAYDVFLYHWGFKTGNPSLMSMFSSLFLHAGWQHLLSNMLFLWVFGNNVEFHLGRVRYLICYLCCGIGATIFYALVQTGTSVTLFGASGAISGVLGLYYLWFSRNQIMVLVVFFIVPFPARWVLLFYLVIMNIFPFLFASGASEVAYGAHIGGFVVGLGLGKLIDYYKSINNPRLFSAASPGFPSFGAAIEAGAWEAALQFYVDMTVFERRSLADWDVLTLADGLTKLERYDSSLAVLVRFVATRATSPVVSLAHLRIGLLYLHSLNQATAAYQHLLKVLELESSDEVREAACKALAQIEDSRKKGPI